MMKYKQNPKNVAFFGKSTRTITGLDKKVVKPHDGMEIGGSKDARSGHIMLTNPTTSSCLKILLFFPQLFFFKREQLGSGRNHPCVNEISLPTNYIHVVMIIFSKMHTDIGLYTLGNNMDRYY